MFMSGEEPAEQRLCRAQTRIEGRVLRARPWRHATTCVRATSEEPSRAHRDSLDVGAPIALRWLPPMLGTVLIVDADDHVRDRLGSAFARHSWSVVVARTGRDALDQLAIHGTRPAAILLDPVVLRADRSLWEKAQSANPLVANVPIVVLAVTPPERSELLSNVRFVVPRATPIADLVTMLSTVARLETPPSPPPRFPTGTGGVEAAELAGSRLDLHGYAEAKLIQYLGPQRGVTMLGLLLGRMRVDAITTTADLHRMAAELRGMGTLEAAVAALLAGRATLIDSDRTLRS
jgi:CheY-like chemotaxis protein